MLPASKSREVQCLSESSVARLIYAMGFMEPSDCSCSRTAPNPSMQASQHTWNGREPSATASQLGKIRIDGVKSSARISRTKVSIAGVNRNLTPLRRIKLIGPSLFDKSGISAPTCFTSLGIGILTNADTVCAFGRRPAGGME